VAVRTNTYRSSSNLTVTGLASLATSSSLIAGWLSPVIDNSSQLDLDEIITGAFALGNGATAGQIAIYAIAQMDDSNWPSSSILSSGTIGAAGAATFKDTTNRDSVAVLVWTAGTRADPGTDDVYHVAASSIAGAFGGFLPRRVQLFVTHSTGVNFAASGHQLTVQSMYETIG